MELTIVMQGISAPKCKEAPAGFPSALSELVHLIPHHCPRTLPWPCHRHSRPDRLPAAWPLSFFSSPHLRTSFLDPRPRTSALLRYSRLPNSSFCPVPFIQPSNQSFSPLVHFRGENVPCQTCIHPPFPPYATIPKLEQQIVYVRSLTVLSPFHYIKDSSSQW